MPPRVAIRFLLPDGPHGYLSNWSAHPFELDGQRWPTVEHYFQAMKFPDDAALQARIRAAATPARAKEVAWSTEAVRVDWKGARDEVMGRALRAKFTQHPALRQQLLATGDAELVEANPDDGYWGDGGDGSGRNRAGELLMELRGGLGGELSDS